MISAEQIAAACGASIADATAWASGLNAAMTTFDIDRPARQAAFLAQCGHESAHLTRFAENLNYTPEALLATFNSSKVQRISAVDAERFGRTSRHPADQRLIACIVYANRMGNGPFASGDGYRFRGRGPIQLTGRDNYARARDFLRKQLGDTVPDFLDDPDQIATPRWGSMSAGLFWHWNDCNDLADAGKFDAITKAINPAMAGADARRALWAAAKQALGVQ